MNDKREEEWRKRWNILRLNDEETDQLGWIKRQKQKKKRMTVKYRRRGNYHNKKWKIR